ncbi:MAG TPA: SDR family NAD(P)-dependent oxidoreductase [Ktedonobacteraceae bacterium]
MDTFIQRPLADILVIALEQAVAAPFATRQLADLGARVIKIERPEVGDFARHYDQTVHGMASHFVWLNRSKESLALNLKDPQGLAVIEHLLAKAAHRFVEQGAQVVVVDLDEHKVANVVHELGSACSFGFVADVTNEERISQLVASTLERFGKIDIYYNNAGIPLSSTPIEMLDLATWQRIMDVNTTAIFLAAKAVLPHMKSQGGGSIIVTASTAGIRPRPGLSAYNASKGAAILLTKSLASELAPLQYSRQRYLSRGS